ncbi:uncharacterized protein A4U43_C07F30140 [Asparagus officinalis]|uniref:RING-type domain-containing protein n=1 Tax=Asparagus officinalis TaxID=4686 RepID=A0A5P1EFX8_ASPOF|nr:uncharacterized protein LOC109850457 [Asparagus officinalis]ONK64806.1 uncharacterized protein A4U43_C07F30140 [Asparagus officinalis]
MWSFASNSIVGCIGGRNGSSKLRHVDPDSEDEVSSCEGLECPICLESFNIVENIPYVLWCGHTLCKNCVLRLQSAIVKFPNLPIQLPLFISCPWCNLLSFRLVYNGVLKFPRKNFILLWMVESMNGERKNSCSSYHADQHSHWPSNDRDHSNINLELSRTGTNYWNAETTQSFLRKLLVFFVHLTSKFPLVIIFLLIIIYAIPASAIILALYIVVTLLLALPSFLILCFAYPTLDWLVREIIT